MSWNAICDRCGFEYESGRLRLEWTGLRVCSPCFDPRHPQEFVKGVRDDQSVPWVRPEPEPVFSFSFYWREDGSLIRRENGIPLIRES